MSEKECSCEMRDKSKYGSRYWMVKTPTSLSKSGEIYLYANEFSVTPNGDLILTGQWHGRDGEHIPATTFAIAAGEWTAICAASCFDGSAVTVEHWEGELAE